MKKLVFFFEKLDPPGKILILVLFARIAAIFDLLGIESSFDMKCKANAKLEDAFASIFLPGVNLDFGGCPSTISPL